MEPNKGNNFTRNLFHTSLPHNKLVLPFFKLSHKFVYQMNTQRHKGKLNWCGATVPRSSWRGTRASLGRFHPLLPLSFPRFLISRATFDASPAVPRFQQAATLGLWIILNIDKVCLEVVERVMRTDKREFRE